MGHLFEGFLPLLRIFGFRKPCFLNTLDYLVSPAPLYGNAGEDRLCDQLFHLCRADQTRRVLSADVIFVSVPVPDDFVKDVRFPTIGRQAAG